MTSHEPALIARSLLEFGAEPGVRLFKNTVLKGWVGKVVKRARRRETVTLYPGDMVLRGARQVHGGLPVGSSDVIGIAHSRFLSAEFKTENVATPPHQHRWLAMIRAHGGVSGIVREPDDLAALIEEARSRRVI